VTPRPQFTAANPPICAVQPSHWPPRKKEGPALVGTPGLRFFQRVSRRYTSVIHQEAAQLLAAAWMTQFAQRLCLYLPDALASDIELFAHFL
jgi:hypothetical protein